MPPGTARRRGRPVNRLRDEVTSMLWPLVSDSSKLTDAETQGINEVAMVKESWALISKNVVV